MLVTFFKVDQISFSTQSLTEGLTRQKFLCRFKELLGRLQLRKNAFLGAHFPRKLVPVPFEKGTFKVSLPGMDIVKKKHQKRTRVNQKFPKSSFLLLLCSKQIAFLDSFDEFKMHHLC